MLTPQTEALRKSIVSILRQQIDEVMKRAWQKKDLISWEEKIHLDYEFTLEIHRKW